MQTVAERSKKSIEIETDDRDQQTGLPLRGKKHKKIEVGLTEFPEGQEKGKGKGYSLPFREMQDNALQDRVIDPNYQFMKIEDATVDMINRMLGKGNFDQKDVHSDESAVDKVVDENGGKVKEKKATLSPETLIQIASIYVDEATRLGTSSIRFITDDDVLGVLRRTAARANTTVNAVKQAINHVRQAQKPTIQKSWPSTYEKEMPDQAVPEAPADIQQAYNEVQVLQDKLAKIDVTLAEMKKKFDAEVKTYKTEQQYDQLGKDITTKWGTIKTLLKGVQGKMVQISQMVLAVIEKKERSQWPNPSKFKDALIEAFPELEKRIDDVFEKARSYEDISKFYMVTEPPKNIIEKSNLRFRADDFSGGGMDPLDDIINDLMEISGILGKLEYLQPTE